MGEIIPTDLYNERVDDPRLKNPLLLNKNSTYELGAKQESKQGQAGGRKWIPIVCTVGANIASFVQQVTGLIGGGMLGTVTGVFNLAFQKFFDTSSSSSNQLFTNGFKVGAEFGIRLTEGAFSVLLFPLSAVSWGLSRVAGDKSTYARSMIITTIALRALVGAKKLEEDQNNARIEANEIFTKVTTGLSNFVNQHYHSEELDFNEVDIHSKDWCQEKAILFGSYSGSRAMSICLTLKNQTTNEEPINIRYVIVEQKSKRGAVLGSIKELEEMSRRPDNTTGIAQSFSKQAEQLSKKLSKWDIEGENEVVWALKIASGPGTNIGSLFDLSIGSLFDLKYTLRTEDGRHCVSTYFDSFMDLLDNNIPFMMDHDKNPRVPKMQYEVSLTDFKHDE